MSDASRSNQEEDGLSPVIDRIESDVASFFRQDPSPLWTIICIALLVIASPLAVFCCVDGDQGKDWSETVKNVVESLAVLAAAFAAFKWLDERRNRATDVLMKLDEMFRNGDVLNGRELVEKNDVTGVNTSADIMKKVDALLRFYVVLYNVLIARQVPERSLSSCYRYWLAFYFHKDRKEFRKYVDANYPTLKAWLHKDCREECRFFRPEPLFNDMTDHNFIEQCGKEVVKE